MAKVGIILKLFSTLTLFFQLASSSSSSSTTSDILNKSSSNLKSIEEISGELASNNNWRIIDLSHNLIEFVDNVKISDVLRNQTHLEEIRMSFNHRFTAGRRNQQIFTNENLKVFECTQCGFDNIESEYFSGLISLTTLKIDSNRINRIFENAFHANKNLKILDLADNKLVNLTANAFEKLEELEVVILTKNPITIPQNLPLLKSKSIKRIRLDNCNLTTIYPETFSQLFNLQTLNLTRNLISILPDTSFIFNLKLKSLFVEDNRMKTFPVSILDSSSSSSSQPSLTELCIDKNKFEVTLEFEKFITKYNETKLRSDKCQSDLSFFIENSIGHQQQKDRNKIIREFSGGISNFFIGSYITLVIIFQAVAFVLLTLYYIKISKYEKLEGGVNYANTILNDDEIYQVLKFNDE